MSGGFGVLGDAVEITSSGRTSCTPLARKFAFLYDVRLRIPNSSKIVVERRLY